MGTLVELKELRERAGVTQEEAARWIGKSRITYTQKELGTNPTFPIEYDLVKLKLELLMDEKEARGVIPSNVHDCIKRVYESEDSRAIASLEAGLEGAIDMLNGYEQMASIMSKLDTLIHDNEEFHVRLDNLEKLIKTETSEENAVRGSR